MDQALAFLGSNRMPLSPGHGCRWSKSAAAIAMGMPGAIGNALHLLPFW